MGQTDGLIEKNEKVNSLEVKLRGARKHPDINNTRKKVNNS